MKKVIDGYKTNCLLNSGGTTKDKINKIVETQNSLKKI